MEVSPTLISNVTEGVMEEVKTVAEPGTGLGVPDPVHGCIAVRPAMADTSKAGLFLCGHWMWNLEGKKGNFGYYGRRQNEGAKFGAWGRTDGVTEPWG